MIYDIRIICHASYTITPTRTYRHLPEMGCDQYHFNTTIHLRGKALHRICWIEGTGKLLVGLPSHTHSRSSLTIVGVQFTRCICVCVCARARARACVRACARIHAQKYTRFFALACLGQHRFIVVILHNCTHTCVYIFTHMYRHICRYLYTYISPTLVGSRG